MPLFKGSSKRTISRNIREVMHSYEETGMIGNSRPASKAAAARQAEAIAYDKAGKSRSKRKPRKR